MKGVDETITPSANYLFLYFSPDVSPVYTGSSQTLQSDCPPEADADACGEICKAE